ncbi:MAG: hypothetical protein IK130_02785 [Oscillospiraceae bacterium]|nr:hypothetical protein [Oscillospiraceae bacterium]
MTFSELRVQYPKFIYHAYEPHYADGRLHIRYRFEIAGLCEFTPEWQIPCAEPAENDPALRRLIFSLGLAELVSYWKITCSPTVELRCGTLSDAQAAWWKQLYFGGLGEFFYRNGIETTEADFMKIVSLGETLPDAPAQKTLSGKLIPVGGGKDSIVTLNLLKDRLSDAYAYQINHRDSSEKAALLAGIPKERVLEVSRTLDKNMLDCNAKGFLNGHTPFSAIVAFSAVLTAYLTGLSQVILSNESSASESTVSEMEVNHQYSKSYRFEQDFARYEAEFLRCGVEYFSLLRPLTEFQIARYFASLPAEYHRIFRSCNAGAKKDAWCGHCAKCLFVAVILSPFLPYAYIREMLGSDILNMPEMMPVLEELCGLRPNKPFECVGSRKEVNIALCLAIGKAYCEGAELPLLIRQYGATPLFLEYHAIASEFGHEWDSNHRVPAELAEIVRSAIHNA